MITAAENRAWDDDVPIPDHRAVGLPIPSIVRPSKIATVDAARAVARQAAGGGCRAGDGGGAGNDRVSQRPAEPPYGPKVTLTARPRVSRPLPVPRPSPGLT